MNFPAPLKHIAEKALPFWNWGGKRDTNTYTEFRRADFFVHAPNTDFQALQEDSEIKQAALSNPAFLKVIALNCDLFSLGKVYVYDRDGAIVENDPFLSLMRRPNPLQFGSQFLWDFMFWVQMGNAYCFVDSPDVSKAGNKLYFLDSSKIEIPNSMEKLRDKLVLSNSRINSIRDADIRYLYADGTDVDIPFKKIIHIPDLSGGLGNWFHSPSKVAALRKVLANNEAGLDSLNINLNFAGKFLVAGTHDGEDVTRTPLKTEEKAQIEKRANSSKPVTAVKSLVEIKRFIEDFSKLQLSQEYKESYFIMGTMFGIPRDVLEAYNSGTYENQEKATGKHISYSLQPKGDILMSALGDMFGYNKEGKTIVIDWEHLPFMQVFAKDRAETEFKKVQSLEKLLSLGVPIDNINKFLDTEFEIEK